MYGPVSFKFMLSKRAGFWGLAFLLLGLKMAFFFDLPFFYDGLSKSTRAQFFLDNALQRLILPAELDSGHPPLFAYGLAAVWALAGKSLWVSHAYTSLFQLGLVWQLDRFLRLQSGARTGNYPRFAFLVLLEPTFLAQGLMIHMELWLVFGFFLGLNAILSVPLKRGQLLAAVVFLSLLNLRGSFFGIALFVFELLYREDSRRLWRRRLAAYALAAVPVLAWHTYHYLQTDWALLTSNESYGSAREAASLMRAAKNVAATGKCFLEFGRLLLWIALAVSGLYLFRKRALPLRRWQHFPELSAVMSFTLVMMLLFVPLTNPIGPRYFLPAYLLLLLAFIYLLENPFFPRPGWAAAGVCTGLLTGHLWIYPPTIAQGWDSSLAFLPYFELKDQMVGHINRYHAGADVGTQFPINSPYTDSRLLSEPYQKFSWKEFDFRHDQFIVESNVSNAFNEAQLHRLKTQWHLRHEVQKGGVYIRLYAQPGLSACE